MSISSINSSPVLQWLQNSLSTAGLTVGNQSSRGSCDAQSASNAISLFQQAMQIMTNQTAPPADAAQSLNVNGTQGQHHHRHHRHSGGGSNDLGNGSFIDQLAQSILSNLQQTDETGASSPTSSSSAFNGNGVSFSDGLASAIANNLLSQIPTGDGFQSGFQPIYPGEFHRLKQLSRSRILSRYRTGEICYCTRHISIKKENHDEHIDQ